MEEEEVKEDGLDMSAASSGKYSLLIGHYKLY